MICLLNVGNDLILHNSSHLEAEVVFVEPDEVIEGRLISSWERSDKGSVLCLVSLENIDAVFWIAMELIAEPILVVTVSFGGEIEVT